MECPQCNGKKIAIGTVLNLPDYFRASAYFRPKGLRPFVITGINVNFKNNFFGCLDCGLVWSKLDPQKLITVIQNKGKESTKREIGLETRKV